MTEEASEQNWFRKMDGYLDWKIIGPDINNPYERTYTTRMLAQLAFDKKMLRQMMHVRCLCDGYEVLFIENLSSPVIRTDHPCIGFMGKNQIMTYLLSLGLEDRVEAEMERIQNEMREELAEREKLDYAEAQHQKREHDRQEREARRRERDNKTLRKDDGPYRIIRK